RLVTCPTYNEDDWNRRGHCLCSGCRGTTDRGDHGHLTANQIGRQCWQSIVLVIELVAVDISETALRRARDRCRGCANVRFERLDFSTDPLPNALDLIVCSEVLYYLKDEAELSRIFDRLANAPQPYRPVPSA